MILTSSDSLSCSLKIVHADIFMLACTLFNEQDKGSNLLCTIKSLYWEKNVQAKTVNCRRGKGAMRLILSKKQTRGTKSDHNHNLLFSHDVTKIQTSKLLIMLIFYVNEV